MLPELVSYINKTWKYCSRDVWNDTRPTLGVNLIKTVNLTIRSFFNSKAQLQACALTYRTILAIVPALALIFAIGRGFGLQTILEDEMRYLFPGQNTGINQTLDFVDRCLNQASEGLFLGIGITFLLWTVISLIGNIEDTFNSIWGVRQGRGMWRKITDYTAIILILPILMICGGGLSASLSTNIQNLFDMTFLSPLVEVIMKIGSYAFTVFFFTALFVLVPNTKVRFKPAFIAGCVTAIAFIFLQWLFISGQTYVSRYNAIYGSFSFIPLFLLWMQFVWVICISGSLICYASQNIFSFSFIDKISNISRDYKEKVTVAIAATIVQEFMASHPPVTIEDLVKKYGLPSKLVGKIVDSLCEIGVLSRVVIDIKKETIGFHPAVDPSILTLEYLRTRFNHAGNSDFIPNFDKNFSGVVDTIDAVNKNLTKATDHILLSDIKLRD